MSLPLDLPPDFPLPAVATALAPFIHTPSETTLIRQQLNATLSTLISEIEQPDEAGQTKQHSLTTQRTIRCLTGTRKAYYNAAVENARLRKQWAELTADIRQPVGDPQAQAAAAAAAAIAAQKKSNRNSRHSVHGSISGGIGGGGGPPWDTKQKEPAADWTKTYDQVLELRRVLSQLTILNKYQQRMTALAQTENKSISGIFADCNQRLPPAPPGTAGSGGPGGGGAGAGQVVKLDAIGDEDILLPLEKAVVDAQERLEAEKKLLEEAKEKVKEKGIDLKEISENVRVRGMLAAKEGLEIWLDEQLRLAGESAGTGMTPKKEMKGFALEREIDPEEEERLKEFKLDDQLAKIKEAYENYVESRENMLHAFLLATQPMKKESIPPKRPAGDKAGPGASGPGGAATGFQAPEILGVLDKLSRDKERMNQLAELTKGIKEVTGTAAKNLDSTMGKLRSESQLLENFGGPIDIKSRGLNDDSPFQDCIQLARQWENAAKAAEQQTAEDVEKHTSAADQKLDQVEKLIEELRALLPEPEQTGRRGKAKKEVTWRGLRGNIGFDD